MRRMFSENKIRAIAREEGGKASVTPEAILENVHGSDTVIVDMDQAGQKVEIRLDQEVVEAIDAKQEKLVAGPNITINGNIISATGGGTGSTVTGTDDGTNWTSITIDGNTKNIPAGGGTVTAEKFDTKLLYSTPVGTISAYTFKTTIDGTEYTLVGKRASASATYCNHVCLATAEQMAGKFKLTEWFLNPTAFSFYQNRKVTGRTNPAVADLCGLWINSTANGTLMYQPMNTARNAAVKAPVLYNTNGNPVAMAQNTATALGKFSNSSTGNVIIGYDDKDNVTHYVASVKTFGALDGSASLAFNYTTDISEAMTFTYTAATSGTPADEMIPTADYIYNGGVPFAVPAIPGPTGPEGPQGPQGETGPQGPAGDPGISSVGEGLILGEGNLVVNFDVFDERYSGGGSGLSLWGTGDIANPQDQPYMFRFSVAIPAGMYMYVIEMGDGTTVTNGTIYISDVYPNSFSVNYYGTLSYDGSGDDNGLWFDIKTELEGDYNPAYARCLLYRF